MISLVLLAAGIFLPTPPAPSVLCRYIDQWRLTNIPISPPTRETEVVHALALGHGGVAVGWLVIRRDGKMWYLDGPLNVPNPPSRDDSVLVLNSLGLARLVRSDVGHGLMIPMRNPVSLTRLAENGVDIYTCY